MRIVVTSDTHYHRQWHTVLTNFAVELADLKPDCLVVAGDVGEGPENFAEMLRLLEVVQCPRLVLSGNHDLWSTRTASSEHLFNTLLPQITDDHGAIWLEGENWICDNVAVCGTNGWYDYSGADPSLPYHTDDYFTFKRKYIVDGDKVDWDWTDVKFAEMLGKHFARRLEALDADAAVQDIIVVTHVPPFAEAIVRKEGNEVWGITNAYFYNLTLGERIKHSAKVRRVVSGHTHVGISAPVADTAIHLDVIPADYGRPAYVVFD
ncbi:MAG TPA: metallophosphoesterase [Aggregatilineales bacterium]|nr:metallophosphoesterase [Aggregatilineales bacterium]